MVALMRAPPHRRAPLPPTDALGLDRKVLERARASRDPRFDGRFFVAVPSTGVYCRPICPAPVSRRTDVRYFETASAAAEAGFRPCLRCRPEAAPGSAAWLGTSAVIRRALRLIEEGALDDASVERLAARVGTGPRHLHRLFVQHLGASPFTVAQTRRLHFAKRLLDSTRLPVTRIALEAGFGSSRRFNDAFRHTYGRSPREIRRDGGAGRPDRGAIRLRLAYRPPYDWEALRAFLEARAIPGVERVDELAYERVITVADGLSAESAGGRAVVRLSPVAGRHELELTVVGARPGALFPICSAARRAFDLSADPALIARAFRGDPLLGPLVRHRPGLRIPGAWDPFECAVRAVLGQQITVAAARTLAARLVARTSPPLPGARPAHARPGAPALESAFPSPSALASADLSGLGIPGARMAALRTLARAVLDRKLDFGAPPDRVAAALEALPGIGAWTAQYIALRALGEPDALPAADIVLRRMAAAGDPPLSPGALERRTAAWRPWRSYAVMHLWRAAGERPADRSERR